MEQGFPEGLRVLAVVDDPACQTTLHKNLIKWKSRVRMCMQAQEAVNVIQEGKEEFDIVISDAKLPDMDGFMFVELVRRLNTKLPIILLYESGELKKKQRMLELGACDFVWKPIRVKELRESITLQHLHLSRKRKAAVSSEEGSTSTAASALLPIKEKGKEVGEESADVAPPVKKQRMAWTQVLHQKFVQVVNQLGLDAGPSKIAVMMNVKGLSREHVSSHMQKYRERLNKQKRRNEVVVAADNGGINQSGSQIVVAPQQNSPNLVINENCVAPIPAPTTTFEGEMSMSMPMPMPMQRGGERVGFGDTSMSYNQGLEHSTIPPQNNCNWNWNWNGGAAGPHQWSTLPPVVSHNPTGVNNYPLPNEFTNSNFYCPHELRCLPQCQTLESSLEQNPHNISLSHGHGHDHERIENTNNALAYPPQQTIKPILDQNLHYNIPASPFKTKALENEAAAALAMPSGSSDDHSLEDPAKPCCCFNAESVYDVLDFKDD